MSEAVLAAVHAANPSESGPPAGGSGGSKDLLEQIADLKKRRQELAKEKKSASKTLKVKQKKLQRLKATLKKFDEESLAELLSLRIAMRQP